MLLLLSIVDLSTCKETGRFSCSVVYLFFFSSHFFLQVSYVFLVLNIKFYVFDSEMGFGCVCGFSGL